MPSPEQIRSAMERYIEALSASDIGGILALYAEGAAVEDPVGGEPLRGLDAIRAFYEAAAPSLKVESSGPICVAGNQCAMPMLAEVSTGDGTRYIDVIDVMKFDDAGKITSMLAYWNPAELREVR